MIPMRNTVSVNHLIPEFFHRIFIRIQGYFKKTSTDSIISNAKRRKESLVQDIFDDIEILNLYI